MFFTLEPDWRITRKPGFTFENEEKLAQGCRTLGPEPGRRGFPTYPDPPRVLIDPKRGGPPHDWQRYSGYWLISDKLKAVLDAVDPEGCAFVKCDVRYLGGEASDGYWLMDIVRLLDAVDESASRLNIRYDDRSVGGKYYIFSSGTSLVLKLDIVGSAHVFGLTFADNSMFCDGEFKDACRRAGIKGMTFQKCGAI
jgi:hypothetical protein